MKASTAVMIAGVLALGACGERENAQPGSEQALSSPAATAVGAVPQEDYPLNPEDGDLVGTDLHGSVPEASGDDSDPDLSHYTMNLSKRYPVAFARWQSQVARVNVDGRDWVSDLEGTSGPMTVVTVGGKPYVSGWVCEIHNCGGNELRLLMAPDQSHIIGYVRLMTEEGQSIERVIGPVKPDELRCLRFFMDDTTSATQCS